MIGILNWRDWLLFFLKTIASHFNELRINLISTNEQNIILFLYLLLLLLIIIKPYKLIF